MGLIPVQRRVEARWNDYAWLPDVVLAAYDTAVTEITGNAAAWQAAQGSVVTDPDGALYVADGGCHRVWRIDPDGRIRSLAGTGGRRARG